MDEFDKWIVVDLDGTLADDSHRSHFIPDWDTYHDACDQDKSFGPIVQIVKELSENHPLLILTERSEKYRTKTGLWLNEQGIYQDTMLMRPEYSPGPNVDWKWNAICEWAGGEHKVIGQVLLVIEDNEKMVEMWRNNNLICLQPKA